MYKTIFKLLLPYVGRYMADYIANHLESRRIAGNAPTEEIQRPVECPPCPPCPPAAAQSADSANAIWYSLSGILLGSALGTILYVFWQDANNEPEFET